MLKLLITKIYIVLIFLLVTPSVYAEEINVASCPYNNFDKYINNDIKSYHWHKCRYNNDSVELML